MATDITSNEPQALPVELYPNVDHIVTEDGAPVDSLFSEKQQRLLTETLHSSWASANGNRLFVAMANVGLFFALRRPPLVPDVLLSMDVELPADLFPKSHRSYLVWEYGKVPDVVVEIVSNREGGEDTSKMAGYFRIGVPYYVIYDLHRLLSPEVLRVYQHEFREYRKLEPPYWFPDVGLGLGIWQGRYEDHDDFWLRWLDVDGVPIPTGKERAAHAEQREGSARQRAEAERQRAEAERQRAEAERQRAEAERERAEAERERADKLAEQLRQLGVEPPR